MGLFSFFKTGPDPQSELSDIVLGTLNWDKDEEGWTGIFDSLQFSIAYDKEETPSLEIVEYARSVLQDQSWLNKGLEDEKEKMISELPDLNSDEIESLNFESLSFFRRKGKNCIFAILSGGLDYRAWRIEYTENTCDGLGFDS